MMLPTIVFFVSVYKVTRMKVIEQVQMRMMMMMMMMIMQKVKMWSEVKNHHFKNGKKGYVYQFIRNNQILYV